MNGPADPGSPAPVVLVDFGGVLTPPLGPAFVDVCRDHGVDPAGFVGETLTRYDDDTAPVGLFESGRIDEHEFARRIAPALDRHAVGPVDAAGWLEDVFARLGRVDAAMSTGLAELAADTGTPLVLVSNSWGGRGRYPWADLPAFAGIVLSEEVGTRKPDPAIFRQAMALVDARPQDCVMVDDLELNVDGATRLGMCGIHHRDAADTLDRLRAAIGDRRR